MASTVFRAEGFHDAGLQSKTHAMSLLAGQISVSFQTPKSIMQAVIVCKDKQLTAKPKLKHSYNSNPMYVTITSICHNNPSLCISYPSVLHKNGR